MTEYQSNSHKSKEEAVEKKDIKPVVKGKKKKNRTRKFANDFLSEDVENVGSFLCGEVLIPAAKKLISDIVTNGIDMILYGETRNKDRKRGTSYVSYDNFSKRDRDRDDRYSNKSRGYSYDDVVLDTRSEAEEVLNQMDGIIDTYGVVSVADLYDLVDITGNYTDNKYGWTSLRNAEVVRIRDGYIIKLPKPLPID